MLIKYIQEREHRVDAFPPEDDSDIGIYDKIYIRERSNARVFVKYEDDILEVINIIKEMDPYEFQHYFPKDLVAQFDKYPICVYIGKFDCDWNRLLKETKEANIPCFIAYEEENMFTC